MPSWQRGCNFCKIHSLWIFRIPTSSTQERLRFSWTQDVVGLVTSCPLPLCHWGNHTTLCRWQHDIGRQIVLPFGTEATTPRRANDSTTYTGLQPSGLFSHGTTHEDSCWKPNKPSDKNVANKLVQQRCSKYELTSFLLQLFKIISNLDWRTRLPICLGGWAISHEVIIGISTPTFSRLVPQSQLPDSIRVTSSCSGRQKSRWKTRAVDRDCKWGKMW